jgi:hypothetical protein
VRCPTDEAGVERAKIWSLDDRISTIPAKASQGSGFGGYARGNFPLFDLGGGDKGSLPLFVHCRFSGRIKGAHQFAFSSAG